MKVGTGMDMVSKQEWICVSIAKCYLGEKMAFNEAHNNLLHLWDTQENWIRYIKSLGPGKCLQIAGYYWW